MLAAPPGVTNQPSAFPSQLKVEDCPCRIVEGVATNDAIATGCVTRATACPMIVAGWNPGPLLASSV